MTPPLTLAFVAIIVANNLLLVIDSSAFSATSLISVTIARFVSLLFLPQDKVDHPPMHLFIRITSPISPNDLVLPNVFLVNNEAHLHRPLRSPITNRPINAEDLHEPEGDSPNLIAAYTGRPLRSIFSLL